VPHCSGLGRRRCCAARTTSGRAVLDVAAGTGLGARLASAAAGRRGRWPHSRLHDREGDAQPFAQQRAQQVANPLDEGTAGEPRRFAPSGGSLSQRRELLLLLLLIRMPWEEREGAVDQTQLQSPDVYGRTFQMDEQTLGVIATRLEARGRHPFFLRAITEYMDHLALSATEAILDLGCGTGVAARAIARRSDVRGADYRHRHQRASRERREAPGGGRGARRADQLPCG
jgi:hypothetical protein